MLFNTLDYAVFLAIVLALYHVLSHRAQNTLLLIASYVFYAAWDWRFLGLILLSTVIDYAVGLGLGRSDSPRTRKRLVTLSIVANLGLLGVFKYAGFFTRSFSDLMALLGFDIPSIVIDIALPVGISFYTFQTLSYTIDVYRGRCEPTRRLADFALFVAFFPQLVAGPIERAVNLLPQIFRERTPTRDQVGSGCWLILWGLYKKVVVADNLAFLVDAVYAPGMTPTNVELVLGTYAFFFQLYCDFSGYTDIARGTARLFGFELVENFNLPVLATSITDFWNRWHMSLGSWIRDYVYIPMGGNRRGELRTSLNLFTMFLLVGLWHGAAWSFVLWGAWNGVMMAVHRLARRPLTRVQPSGRAGILGWLWTRRLAIFHLNCFSLLLFRATTVEQIGTLSVSVFSPPAIGRSLDWWLPMAVLIGPLLLMEAWQSRANDHEVVLKQPLVVRVVVYAVLMCGIVLLGEEGDVPFVYFQF